MYQMLSLNNNPTGIFLGTAHRNNDGLTRGHAISDRGVWRSKGGRVAPARKMLFPPGSENPIVRGNPKAFFPSDHV